jgi:murein DD-endopeptidase MepM/ murein hydrolase activator NlpD
LRLLKIAGYYMNIILSFKRVAMLACVAAFSVFKLSAQGSQDSQQVKFRYPLDVTMSLSGNYGELRSNHFHGGIDFRVGGVVGAPIYATERGYISRITVGPSGYGNAIYITHPNGYVSVYGHMHCFADHIAKYVREK